jgi:hypothetical protein
VKPARLSGSERLPAATVAVLLSLLTVFHTADAQDDPVAPAFQFDEARQFDFWSGAWRVSLRAQQDDLSWQESVIADARVWKILDGKAVLELWDSEPIKGFSLRWFDTTTNRWNLWLNWPSPNRSAGSKLEGQFRHGRGEFFSTATAPDGGSILTRYTFSDIAADRLRWDDAYSSDAGKTWTGNWIMEFSRSAAAALAPDRETNAHTYDFGDRCTLPEFRTLNALAGHWQGTVADTDHFGVRAEHPATLSIHRILDGCAVMAFTHAPTAQPATREFRLLTFNTVTGKFEENLLDNEPGTPFRLRFGEHDAGSLQFENSDEGHRASWSSAADGTLTIREFRVPAAGGSFAQRRFQLTRE